MKFKSPFFIALSFMIVNLAVRIGFLASQDIALDEPFTLFWSQQSLVDIWKLAAFENNPPLHFIITHFWVNLFGLDAFWARLPSLLFTLAGISLLIEFVAKRRSLFAAIFMGVLLTLSTENIFYSQEARAYSLLFLLTVLALRGIYKIIDNPTNSLFYIELSIVNILLIYTHYLSIWIFIAQVITWLIFSRSIAAFRKSIPAIVLFLLGFSPLVLAAIARINHMQGVDTWVPDAKVSQLYGNINIMLNGASGSLAFILITVTGIAFGIKNINRDKIISKDLLITTFWFLIIYVGLFLQSMLFQSVFIPRYLFFCSVPLFVAMVFFIDTLITLSWLRFAAVLLLIVAMLPGYSMNPENHREMKQVVGYINSQNTPKTALVICPASFDLAYIYHANRDIFKSPNNYRNALENRAIYPVDHIDQLPDSIKSFSNRIIFLDADSKFTLPNNSILQALEHDFKLKSRQHIDLIFDVYVFER